MLIIPLTIQWWSVWYPGAEPGGGSYIAQRMLAAKTENDALKGTLFFNFAHYALRPWPWIIVALASMLVYPQLSDIQTAFPNMDPTLLGHDIAYPAMLRFLPAGFLGLMVAGMLAAYVSTVATHLNWGTSYLVNDLYKRFLRPGLEERQYVFMGRVVTALLMLVAALLTYVLDTARESFELLLSIGAGTGLLYLLRWFWWRVNAWSEVSAMVASFAVSLGLFIARNNGFEMASHVALIWTVAITTLVWITVTLATAPADRSRLLEFYRLVRPSGPGWESIRRESGLPPSTDSMANSVLGWVLGCLFVYSALFGTGSYIYGRTGQALVLTVVFLVSGAGLWRLLPRMWR